MRSRCHQFGFVLLLLLILVACNTKPRQESRKVTPQQLLEMNKKMVGAESEVMDKYIADKALEMQTSETGLRYILDKTSNEPLIEVGDAVSLKYTTSLLNGTICYTSDKNGLMNFVVGKAQVEAGLEEAILMLAPNDKAKLIMPPYMAHGIAGDGNKIPKLAIIIMDIEVVEVHKAGDEE